MIRAGNFFKLPAILGRVSTPETVKTDKVNNTVTDHTVAGDMVMLAE